MATPRSRPQSSLSNLSPSDMVTVAINHLSLHPDSDIQHNDRVTKLYLEYCFLNVPRDETETPYSLPKPDVNKQISFNFTKVFHVDIATQYERRQYLASMLLPNDPDQGRIVFSVISEPEEEDGEEDCEDVGVAYADIRDILSRGEDLEDADIPIYDVNDESVEIGTLCVTVKCLAAIRAVQREIGERPDP